MTYRVPIVHAALACLALLVVQLCVALPAARGAAVEYRIVGHGWGHGIGMSQYGAQGLALAGKPAPDIIRHYYSGVTVQPLPASSRSVDVLLASSMTSAVFQVDGDNVVVSHGGKRFPMLRNDVITISLSDGRVVSSRRRGTTTTILHGAANSIAVISGRPGSIHTAFAAENGTSHRHYRGAMIVRPYGSALAVVNRVALEDYLRGVVPSEMPASWHPAALQAQAIAARSYAVATRRSGVFHHYADTRSQMYTGIEGEQVRTNDAIAATAHQVAVSEGQPIPAFFFSSSGGRTASIEDVWDTSPRSYLRSVPDPYERSPYRTWVLRYTATAFTALFAGDINGGLRAVRVSKNPSQRAENVGFIGTGGSSSLRASTVQARLGLRSTWFTVERLSMAASATTVAPGATIRIAGVVPTPGNTYLVYRIGRGPWIQAGAALRESRYGAFAVYVKPGQTRTYALKRANRIGPSIVVRVQ